MALNRDMFADLDALTVEQIEAGLAAGVWGDDGRPTVEHYVLKRRFAADQRNVVVTPQQAGKGGMEQAASAKLWQLPRSSSPLEQCWLQWRPV